MTVDSKKGIVLILLVCIGVASITLIYLKLQTPQDNEFNLSDNPNAESSNQEQGDSAKNVETENKEILTQTQVNLSYDKALAIYQKNGYRLEISNCSSTPGKMNIKSGTNFMLDNRDSTKHTFKIGNVSRVISGYSFSIISAPKAGTYNLTCDGKGSAEITIYP